MALPSTTQTVLDGGLGITTPASSRAHVVGVFESGPSNTPTLIGNQRQLKETFGLQGPGNDLVGGILDVAGGPVLVTRTATTTAATYGQASMASSISPGANNAIGTVVATSAPKNDFAIVVNIIASTGLLASTTFQYSLDGGKTFSSTIQAAATVPLNTSGVTLEFGSGVTQGYTAGATYTGTSKAPHYTSADLTTAFAAIDLSILPWDFFVFSGEAATAAAAATLFATIGAKMASYASSKDRYYRAIMGAGEGTPASVVTAFGALTDVRMCVGQGKARAPASFGIVGRSLPLLPTLIFLAERAAGNVISTDLAQTSGADSVGPLTSVTEPSQNEFTQPAGLDDIRISTLRTYSNLTGIFLTNARLMCPPGSDFEFWQHGRMMDAACVVVSGQHSSLISSNVICKADGSGSLTEPAALTIEKKVQRALDNVVGSGIRGVGPKAIDGSTGHLSDQKYQVDRTNNVLSTKTLITTVSLVPRGYLKFLTATLSFRLAA
jgi:Protein of unknown function (DUF2586)